MLRLCVTGILAAFGRRAGFLLGLALQRQLRVLWLRASAEAALGADAKAAVRQEAVVRQVMVQEERQKVRELLHEPLETEEHTRRARALFR